MDDPTKPTDTPPNPDAQPVGTLVGTPLAAPEPPPAAATVAQAEFTEREIELQRQIEAERGRVSAAEARAKKAETDAAYHADENRRLKDAVAVPPSRKARRVRSFMGFTQEIEED